MRWEPNDIAKSGGVDVTKPEQYTREMNTSRTPEEPSLAEEMTSMFQKLETYEVQVNKKREFPVSIGSLQVFVY